MRIVCLSDTHGRDRHIAVPDGDVLLHAGDLTGRGTLAELETVVRWLEGLPHRYKVVVAGNHDFCLQQQGEAARSLLSGLNYLEDEALEIEGLKLYGSPWQPWFCNWAFNLRRGPDLQAAWAKIPEDTQVLITHGPPAGILDRTDHKLEVGCEDLTLRLEQLPHLRLHLFGHIHEAYGKHLDDQGRLFLNASICTLAYKAIQAPWVVDWDGSVMTLVEG